MYIQIDIEREKIGCLYYRYEKMAKFSHASISAAGTASTVQILTKTRLRKPTKVVETRIYLVIFLLLMNIYNDQFGGISIIPTCCGGPMPTSLVLPPTSSAAIDTTANRVANLTYVRQHGGDIFTASGKPIFIIFISYSSLSLCVSLSK